MAASSSVAKGARISNDVGKTRAATWWATTAATRLSGQAQGRRQSNAAKRVVACGCHGHQTSRRHKSVSTRRESVEENPQLAGFLHVHPSPTGSSLASRRGERCEVLALGGLPGAGFGRFGGIGRFFVLQPAVASKSVNGGRIFVHRPTLPVLSSYATRSALTAGRAMYRTSPLVPIPGPRHHERKSRVPAHTNCAKLRP